MKVAESIINRYADNTDLNSVSYLLRKKRFNLFLKILDVSSMMNILDVGGSESIWMGTGLEHKVTILNSKIYQKVNPFRYIEGNACNMNGIGNNSYDIIFSNSVIEHVGDGRCQKMFANELMRVGKKCWIQTPNKYFPIEPHFVFPYFQFMPKRIQEYIGVNWKYSQLKRNNENVFEELNKLNLLSKTQLKNLFPGFAIYEEKYFGLIKSLVAYRK
jgi:hypothetical protein